MAMGVGMVMVFLDLGGKEPRIPCHSIHRRNALSLGFAALNLRCP